MTTDGFFTATDGFLTATDGSTMRVTDDPRDAVAVLAASTQPFLLGVRHHSPALAAVIPALLDAAGTEILCVELPADFQPWLPHLADPNTIAPIALAGAHQDGRLGFYPFADFSPELAAIRWAHERGVEVLCCDLPLSSPAWSTPSPTAPSPSTSPDFSPSSPSALSPAFSPPPSPAPAFSPPRSFADTLSASGTGRDGDDLWDRTVEVLAPGCTPEAVRRAALGVGWALRQDAEATTGISPTDQAREAHMRTTLTQATTSGHRVTALIGAFHAPALLPTPQNKPLDSDATKHAPEISTSQNRTQKPSTTDSAGRAPGVPASQDEALESSAMDGVGRVSEVSVSWDGALEPGTTDSAGRAPGVSGSRDGASGPGGADGTERALGVPVSQGEALESGAMDGVGRGAGAAAFRGGVDGGPVTSLVPYAFDLLDARSGYPAGIRDPRWQQEVLLAGGDPGRVREAAARAITGVCRALRADGHPAGTGEAAETLRVADDLARLRGLPAPGRGELVEAVTTVLGQGEPLGRGRAVARALERVLVGAERGRVAPGTPRSGLGPSVEEELAALRLPCPKAPEAREVRLDPLRSELDRRREILLRRLLACGAGYGEPVEVSGTGDGAALTTRWRLAWTPAVPARLDLAGVRGVTAAQAAAGTLGETFRRESAEGGVTCARVLAGLRAAARCDLPELVADRLADAALTLPAAGTLPELIEGLDLLEALRKEHLPGTTARTREQAAELAATLLETAVRALPGLAGSDRPEDATALVDLAVRAGEHRLGLRLDDALGTLAHTGSPMMRGVALAVRVLLDLDDSATLGVRAAGWIDTATDPDGRRALTRRLTGLLTAAGPLLQNAPTALTPLIERVETLTDQAFLDRLPALRGGFDTLTPAARTRLLETITEHLGDRIDLTLDAPSSLLALWTTADTTALTVLEALNLPVPKPFTQTTPKPTTQPPSVPPLDPFVPPLDPTRPSLPKDDVTRLGSGDRWRLLLGRESERLSGDARRYARALDELYGVGKGEGADSFGVGDGGGQEASFPTAREWAAELEALFGSEVREEVLARAVDAGRMEVLAELDPGAVRPSVELLTSVLSLVGGMPEHRLARLRPLVRRLVDELAKELATRMRPALTGLATPRPTRRPGGRLDLPRTLRANLAHTRRLEDGRVVVVPERPVFSTRSRKESDWRLILVVDVSGSMEASVVWSALTAAVLGGVPTLSTHFLAFSTEVIDLTDRVTDPLSLLLEVRVGGGTRIAAGLAHARSLVTVPSRTLVVVVSDFEEGGPLGGLLGEVRALTTSGVHLLGCAALDDTGTPRYSQPVARQLAAAGMQVAALSPLALARWVGDRLRGESR